VLIARANRLHSISRLKEAKVEFNQQGGEAARNR
jgi:hypothetical protein